MMKHTNLVDVTVVVGDVACVGRDVGCVNLFDCQNVLVLIVRENFAVLGPGKSVRSVKTIQRL